MCLFFECHQYFVLIFICPTILVTCTEKYCVYSFLYLRNCLVYSFGKTITQGRLTQILTLVTTTPVAMRVRRDLFELNSLHKRLVFSMLRKDYSCKVSQHPAASHNVSGRDIIFSFLYVVLSIASPFFLNLLFPDGVGLEVVCTEWF